MFNSLLLIAMLLFMFSFDSLLRFGFENVSFLIKFAGLLVNFCLLLL